MKTGRVFTDEELREMGAQTAERIQAAIDANDKEKAKELTHRLVKEALESHDSYLYWITSILSFIGRRYGDKALEEALREYWAVRMRPAVELFQRCDEEGIRQKAAMVARMLRHHFMPVKVEEDEEKFIFQMQPCGSGGRLIRDGAYESPMSFLKIEKPQPMTYGQKDFPVYCTHGSIMAILCIEWTGAPLFFSEPSDKLGERPCKVYLYKDPKATPTEFYAKLGKEKRS